MKNSIYTIIITCLLPIIGSAQDYHSSNIQNFSQLYNPALVALKNDMTANVSYRTQWRSVGSPFNAIGASFASTVEPTHRKNEGHLALGFNAYREQLSRQGSVTSLSINAAQHIRISKYSSLSLGLGFGTYGRSFNEENGTWESQHNGLFYDENLASGEVFESNQKTTFDVGTGMVYAIQSRDHDVKLFQVGISAFHLNQPIVSYTSAGLTRLPIRTVLFSSFAVPFEIDKNESFVEGTILYQNQGKFNSFMIGGMVKTKLMEKAATTNSASKTNSLYVGAGMYLRGKDAFIFNLQVQRSNWTAALAYDATISSLKNSSRGAVEFQLSCMLKKYSNRRLYELLN
ncbi:MAG: PorP/SprF family type IX secretion system membrane protein [Crocinitomicaceae bacterium]|nr:PorP/SprF family type IX secretion system membrane protein [Crocinitomicaceae bacterium]